MSKVERIEEIGVMKNLEKLYLLVNKILLKLQKIHEKCKNFLQFKKVTKIV